MENIVTKDYSVEELYKVRVINDKEVSREYLGTRILPPNTVIYRQLSNEVEEERYY